MNKVKTYCLYAKVTLPVEYVFKASNEDEIDRILDMVDESDMLEHSLSKVLDYEFFSVEEVENDDE